MDKRIDRRSLTMYTESKTISYLHQTFHMDNLIARLHQTPRKVFTNKALALIWQETNSDNLKSKIFYYVKRGSLIRLTRGIFTKDKSYDPKELATSIYTPSYISFETVLREGGIVFQHYDRIFVAGPWPKIMKIDQTQITFRKLKETVLFSPVGIDNKNNYNIATLERAFLDTLYLFPQFHFDNLRPINWEKCSEIVRIYNNQQLIKRLKEYKKQYAQ